MVLEEAGEKNARTHTHTGTHTRAPVVAMDPGVCPPAGWLSGKFGRVASLCFEGGSYEEQTHLFFQVQEDTSKRDPREEERKNFFSNNF